MTLRGGGGPRAMTLKVATATGFEGDMRILNPDMNITLRAIVRNTVNVCGQRL